MSITVLNYLDQTLVNNITEQAQRKAENARVAEETAQILTSDDFAAVLEETLQSFTNTQNTSSAATCPEDLNTIFAEASSTYNVSEQLLKAIAKTESNFNASAVSSAGAVGIMQLMPSTAESLGVSNSYDPQENIMGGANLISQLLTKYSGNVSLALAAYNSGSANVDKYDGIPPFTETQNYVEKVLSYMQEDITVPSAAADNTVASDSSDSSNVTSIFDLTGSAREKANEIIGTYLSSHNVSMDMLVTLAEHLKTKANEASGLGQELTVSVLSGPNSPDKDTV